MKNFQNIQNQSFSFSSCEGCGAKCCSGLYGSNFSQLLLEDFEEVYENFAILFTFGDMNYLKANIILTKEYEFCKYIKDNICTIYDKRPNVCKNYPLSTNIDNIKYVDISCPALVPGSNMVKKGEVDKNFDSKNLSNYQDKFLNTHFYLEKFSLKSDFEEVLNIKGLAFYKYTKTSDDKYMNFHFHSLKNL